MKYLKSLLTFAMLLSILTIFSFSPDIILADHETDECDYTEWLDQRLCTPSPLMGGIYTCQPQNNSECGSKDVE